METSCSRFGRDMLLYLVKAVHFAVCVISFCALRYWLDYGGRPIPIDYIHGSSYAVVLYAVILLFFMRTYNGYLLGYTRIRQLVFSQLLAQLFSMIGMWVLTSITWVYPANASKFLLMFLLQVMFDVIWSCFANRLFFLLYEPKKTLLVYRNDRDKRRLGTLGGKQGKHLYRIVEELRYDGGFRELQPRLQGYEAILVTGVNSRCRNGILKWGKEKGVPVLFLPHVGDVLVQGAQHVQPFDSPILLSREIEEKPSYTFVKRAFDVCASLLALIILSPVMLVTALAIKMSDGGPAVYKQVRLTKGGREFTIYKFRSMRVDAEKDGVARLSAGDADSRITPIGRFVRRFRLDELPQLINILKGDMSIVGPRPERPEIAEKYCETMPEFSLRLQAKAGLTGYAQVYGKYNTDPYEKLEFDMLYINDMSVITDLKLIFATVAVLFSKESTQGVKETQETALDADTEYIID